MWLVQHGIHDRISLRVNRVLFSRFWSSQHSVMANGSENVRVDLGDYVRQSRSSHSLSGSVQGWMSRLSTGDKGYLPLFNKLKLRNPLDDREKESVEQVEQNAANDPCFPSLSRKQRLTGFVVCFGLGLLCMGVAACYIPILALRSRKFAILFTFGSLSIILSFGILRGPQQHLHSMLQSDRLPFTTVYLISVLTTLYCALAMQSTILTILCGIIQMCALTWYTLSYIPGGETGVKFFAKMTTSLVKKTASSTASSSGLRLDV